MYISKTFVHYLWCLKESHTYIRCSAMCSCVFLRLDAFLSHTYCWHSGLIKKASRRDKTPEEDRKTRLAVLSDKDTAQIPDDSHMSLGWHLLITNKGNRREQAKLLCLRIFKYYTSIYTSSQKRYDLKPSFPITLLLCLEIPFCKHCH